MIQHIEGQGVAGNLDGESPHSYPQSMDIHLSADLEAQVKRWVSDTGCTADELVEDAVTGYLAELSQVRETLDSRYDQIERGEVELLDGEEVIQKVKAEIETKRRRSA